MSDPKFATIPADDLERSLAVARPDEEGSLPHIGLVGDTYTIVLSGKQTAGRFTTIDMHVPPGGGPAPHRHDFEKCSPSWKGKWKRLPRPEVDTARRGDDQYPRQRAAQLHQRLPGAGASAVRVRTVWAGGVLREGRGASRLPHDPPAAAGRPGTGSIHGQRPKAGAAVPHRTTRTVNRSSHDAKVTAWPKSLVRFAAF